MEKMEMREVIGAIRRRFWFIAAPAILAAVCAGLFTQMFVSPVYQASAKLIIHHAADAGGNAALDLGSVNLNLRLVETYKQILRTDAIMERVAERYPELRTTAAELMNRVSVSTSPESQVMTLTVRDRSYERAAAMVNGVSHVFRETIPSIMHVNNVDILSEAKPALPAAPVSPRPALNAAVAFVLALLVAGAAAIFLEAADDTLRNPEDIEAALGEPPLAVVSEATRSDFRAAVRERKPQPVKEVPYAPIQR